MTRLLDGFRCENADDYGDYVAEKSIIRHIIGFRAGEMFVVY